LTINPNRTGQGAIGQFIGSPGDLSQDRMNARNRRFLKLDGTFDAGPGSPQSDTRSFERDDPAQVLPLEYNQLIFAHGMQTVRFGAAGTS
jgi:hypothetical protein